MLTCTLTFASFQKSKRVLSSNQMNIPTSPVHLPAPPATSNISTKGTNPKRKGKKKKNKQPFIATRFGWAENTEK